MDIRKYMTFLKVAEAGNMTRAGELLGYTQSGISHMMKSLEAEIGFPLFTRVSTGIRLNSNGQQLLPIIRDIVKWDQHLEQLVSAINGIESGTINIAAFSSISTHWLPLIMKEFRADYPNIKLVLREGGVDEIGKWLDTGMVDMGFFSRQPHQSYEWIHLKKDRLLAILPKDCPSGNSPLPMGFFDKKPFIMSVLGFDFDIHRVLESNNINTDVQLSSMDDYAIVSMVANGLGISILPELVIQWSRHLIKTLPLDPPQYRVLGIALPSMGEASPATKKFISYTIKILAREGLIDHKKQLRV